jgi:hypothetical protein
VRALDAHLALLSRVFPLLVSLILSSPGDHLLIARKTARDLEMGDQRRSGWPVISGPNDLPMLDGKGQPPSDLARTHGALISAADGFAQVFPEHKFLIVETYRQLGYKCGMTGDGGMQVCQVCRGCVSVRELT